MRNLVSVALDWNLVCFGSRLGAAAAVVAAGLGVLVAFEGAGLVDWLAGHSHCLGCYCFALACGSDSGLAFAIEVAVLLACFGFDCPCRLGLACADPFLGSYLVAAVGSYLVAAVVVVAAACCWDWRRCYRSIRILESVGYVASDENFDCCYPWVDLDHHFEAPSFASRALVESTPVAAGIVAVIAARAHAVAEAAGLVASGDPSSVLVVPAVAFAVRAIAIVAFGAASELVVAGKAFAALVAIAASAEGLGNQQNSASHPLLDQRWDCLRPELEEYSGWYSWDRSLDRHHHCHCHPFPLGCFLAGSVVAAVAQPVVAVGTIAA